MQAFLVDDERLAISKLERMLKEFDNVEVIATFTDPALALEAAPQLNPDVIFLDIEMPEVNGLQVATLLQSTCPKAFVVFITAYNMYAVEAFELNALDYILKPANRNRLEKTVQRLTERLADQSAIIPAQITKVCCFQSLRFDYDKTPHAKFRWRTAKTQELFAYLLHNRNRFISRDILIELLWPDFPHKKASTLLYTTIYQLRQSLKQGEIDLTISNVSAGEGYMLENTSLSVDVEEWEKGIQKLPAMNIGTYSEHQRLFELYAGDYLGDYDFVWAEGERQRLRTIWLHLGMNLGVFYTASHKLAEAVTVYQRIVDMQPYFEQGYLGLMKVYDLIGEHNAVEDQYHLLAGILDSDLGVEPSPEITGWYKNWVTTLQRK